MTPINVQLLSGSDLVLEVLLIFLDVLKRLRSVVRVFGGNYLLIDLTEEFGLLGEF